MNDSVSAVSAKNAPVLWVRPLYAERKSGSQGPFYVIHATDQQYTTSYRVYCDDRIKGSIVRFLAAIDAKVETWMPIEPKNKEGCWRVCLGEIDAAPPAAITRNQQLSLPLSFEKRRNFSCMQHTKKQTFTITEDYAAKVDKLVTRFGYLTKSDYIANVIANHADLCDQMDAIC